MFPEQPICKTSDQGMLFSWTNTVMFALLDPDLNLTKAVKLVQYLVSVSPGLIITIRRF